MNLKGMLTISDKNFDKLYVIMEDGHEISIVLPKGSNTDVVSNRLKHLAKEVQQYGSRQRNLNDM